MANTQDLLQRLYEVQFLTPTNLLLVRNFASKWKLSLYDALVETKVLSETKLADFLAEDSEFKRIRKIPTTDKKTSNIWPFSLAIKYLCYPLKIDQVSAKMALAEPDPSTLRFLQATFGGSRDLEVCVIEKARIIDGIANLYDLQEQERFFKENHSKD